MASLGDRQFLEVFSGARDETTCPPCKSGQYQSHPQGRSLRPRPPAL